MNKWKGPFLILTGVNILTLAFLLPPILAETPPPSYYRGLSRNLAYGTLKSPGELPDYQKDTDGDGLTDYEENRKYLSDPQNRDSDGDGLEDGLFPERSEFTRTYRAVVDLRHPYSLEDMNDFYQDARLLQILSPEVSRFEVILYPEAREELSPGPYVPVETEYTSPTFAKNYDSEMKTKLLSLTAKARTDLQAVMILQDEFNRTRYVSLDKDLGYSSDLPLQFQYYRNSRGVPEVRYYGYPTTRPMGEILDRLFFADTMFLYGTRGACSSSATLRGALFRAAGLEEMTVFTIPLFYAAKGDGTVVDVKNLPSGHNIKRSDRPGVSDHFFNIVKIGRRWIRVDTGLIDTGVHGPYIKLLAMHDQADASWEIWNYANYWERRPYRYVSIEERFPIQSGE